MKMNAEHPKDLWNADTSTRREEVNWLDTGHAAESKPVDAQTSQRSHKKKR